MAIYHVGGKPGSGKTFWAVHHLISKYFDYNKIHDEFLPKGMVSIITNIDELRLNHFNLDEMIEKAGGIETFFTVDYQRSLLIRMNRIVYIIDEVSKYFAPKFSNEKVIFFFQYHRHLGIDFYLLSTSVSGVCKEITKLVEYRLQAYERSKAITSEFKFSKIVGGDHVGSVLLHRDIKIFRLYRSMDQDEVEKVKSVVTRYIIMIGGACLLAVLVLGYFFNSLGAKSRLNEAKKAQVHTVKNTPSLEAKDRVDKVKLEEKGVPLAEQSLKGKTGMDDETLGLRVKGPHDVDMKEVDSDYIKIHVLECANGDPIAYTEDGRILKKELIQLVMRDAVKLDGAFFVKKWWGGADREPSATPPLTKQGTNLPIQHGNLSK